MARPAGPGMGPCAAPEFCVCHLRIGGKPALRRLLPTPLNTPAREELRRRKHSVSDWLALVICGLLPGLLRDHHRICRKTYWRIPP